MLFSKRLSRASSVRKVDGHPAAAPTGRSNFLSLSSNVMNRFYQTITLVGEVKKISEEATRDSRLRLLLLSGDQLDVHVSDTTSFEVLMTLTGRGQRAAAFEDSCVG
jgi:hypothetical protein